MQKKEYLEKFDSIVKGFSKEDRIALIPDLDADGVSAGAIIYNAIKQITGKEPLLIIQHYKTTELLPETLEILKKEKIQKLIIVDSAAEQSKESLEKAEKIVDEILVIDHHKDYNYNSSEKVFIIKAQYINTIDPSKYPSSKLAYDLFSRHADLEKYSWIASVGLIGDNQLKQWESFVETAIANNDSSIEEFFGVMVIISAVETLAPENLGELLVFYANASSPNEIIASEFSKYIEILNNQIDEIMKKFNSDKELFDEQNLVWFEFKSKSNIKSVVINKVSNEMFPNKTIIFVQDKGGDFVSFSVRRQDFKVKTNELLENAVEGFEGAGAGGHIPASAGRIRKKDLPAFKKRI
ncbi:MAG: DHH family phosphoesterase, partial [archaeon]|nr:DHH family phosphoesterase [archaeon]